MNLQQAMAQRHSVRAYTDKPIDGKALEQLREFIRQSNERSGLHMQLVLNDPKAFEGFMARYGKFSGVRNYIALVGKKADWLEEKLGYHGESVALYAQTLGLNTCWVGLTYARNWNAFEIGPGEKLGLVISVGYGVNQGVPHTSKPREKVMAVQGPAPDWFLRGVDAALLAPTAMNQQKFMFRLENGRVSARAGLGFYSKVDLGIAKYHFELGAGKANFQWA